MATNDWEAIPGQPARDIAGALATAQGEFGPVLRDKTVTVTMKSGGKYTFAYAPLESILHAVKPALAKNCLALTQAMLVADGKDYVETTLRHASGQFLSNRIPLFVRDDGPQAYGSALTYARRYGVTLLLCIAADDDDDGNAAEGNSAERSSTPAKYQPQKPHPAPVEAAATTPESLAQKFREALKLGIDGRVYQVHLEANGNMELYDAAWELLDAGQRREIKAAIERVKKPNTNRAQANA